MDGTLNKKILVIDDEQELLQLIHTVLKKEGFKHVYTEKTGKGGLELFKNIQPDLVILDIMLPDIEGYELCKKIRNTSRVPILFISAKSEELDKILGFAIGGDDYITKPFSPKELAYRVKAHLRRSTYQMEKDDPILQFGPFRMDPKRAELSKGEDKIELKPKEFKLLQYLANYPNQIMSKEKLCNEVWGEDYIGYDNTIMVHIRKIREKIERDPSKPEYLVTVKGLGYKLLIKD
ncbi:response regulator transcription factor [Inediibacterium massiliense]|uniref:response regulator transcription factor n=1 Tax=Inediibacterium massiliense TaxID=1658111 RepID=UPI0006B529BE|nr:response regulator transcription factor [Inediibacterium massiliense]